MILLEQRCEVFKLCIEKCVLRYHALSQYSIVADNIIFFVRLKQTFTAPRDFIAAILPSFRYFYAEFESHNPFIVEFRAVIECITFYNRWKNAI